MRRLVVLRPEPGTSRTVARAREQGLEAEAIPLFAVRPLDWEVPEGRFDALLLTSANAVRHGGPTLSAMALPVHAVGDATAAAARAAGLAVVSVGSGGVGDLLSALPPGLRLLHLCGEDRIDPGAVPQRIVAVPVYRAEALPVPAGLAEQLAGQVVAVHSPRAGRRLAELVDERADMRIAAISPQAAAACGDGWAEIASAERPDDAALLSLAARLCQQSAP